MKQHIRRFAFVALLLTGSQTAQATVSEYTEFYIPYQRLQSEEVCLHQQIMEAEFGIPLASMMTGIFSPTKSLHQRLGMESEWKNINLLADGAAIPWELNFDRYHESGVYDYSFTLDMGPLVTELGDSAAARQKGYGQSQVGDHCCYKNSGVHAPGRPLPGLGAFHQPAFAGEAERLQGLFRQERLAGLAVYFVKSSVSGLSEGDDR